MEYLQGWTAIGRVFGVTGKQVREWAMDGAPILKPGEKPVTRLVDLWEWLLKNDVGRYEEDDL